MHGIIKKLKKLFHIAAIVPGQQGQQVLAIHLGKKHCCFAITDNSGRRLYQLEYYTCDEVNENFLNNLITVHPELEQSFQKVLISYDHPQSVLMPLQYHQDKDDAILINLIHGSGKKTITLNEEISGWQLRNIYSVPKETTDWLNHKFPDAVYWHNYTSGIRNIKDADDSGSIWIDFRTEDFSLIAAKDNKLLLAQSFCYSAPDDVIYYLLKTCREFSLSPLETKIILSGLVEERSVLYKEMYQYFLNIEFRVADWTMNGDNEYPAHFFTSLNDLAKCAS